MTRWIQRGSERRQQNASITFSIADYFVTSKPHWCALPTINESFLLPFFPLPCSCIFSPPYYVHIADRSISPYFLLLIMAPQPTLFITFYCMLGHCGSFMYRHKKTEFGMLSILLTLLSIDWMLYTNGQLRT